MNPNLETYRGLKWPKKDIGCRAVVFDTVTDMEPALALCKQRRTAVQAGGNCGVWALYLDKRFDWTWTFEPDPLNFEALEANVFKTNIVAVRSALGSRTERRTMTVDPLNIGANYLSPERGSGPDVQVRPLDSWKISDVDYLCLDIEGFELEALQGAGETIRKYRPVIQIEDKGLSTKYGVPKGAAEVWLADCFGYKVRYRIHRDVILSCD